MKNNLFSFVLCFCVSLFKKEKMMEVRSDMEQACIEGNHEVVENLLSSHPESLDFSYEVGILFFFSIIFFKISF